MRKRFYWSERVFNRSCHSMSGQNRQTTKKPNLNFLNIDLKICSPNSRLFTTCLRMRCMQKRSGFWGQGDFLRLPDITSQGLSLSFIFKISQVAIPIDLSLVLSSRSHSLDTPLVISFVNMLKTNSNCYIILSISHITFQGLDLGFIFEIFQVVIHIVKSYLVTICWKLYQLVASF